MVIHKTNNVENKSVRDICEVEQEDIGVVELLYISDWLEKSENF